MTISLNVLHRGGALWSCARRIELSVRQFPLKWPFAPSFVIQCPTAWEGKDQQQWHLVGVLTSADAMSHGCSPAAAAADSLWLVLEITIARAEGEWRSPDRLRDALSEGDPVVGARRLDSWKRPCRECAVCVKELMKTLWESISSRPQSPSASGGATRGSRLTVSACRVCKNRRRVRDSLLLADADNDK